MVKAVKNTTVDLSSYLSVLEHCCCSAYPEITFKKNAILFTAILYLQHRKLYRSFCITQSFCLKLSFYQDEGNISVDFI